MRIVKISVYHSPAGELLLGVCGGKICLCDWIGCGRSDSNIKRVCRALNAVCEYGIQSVSVAAFAQLDEYFAHKRRIFDIPLTLSGSFFQKCVWYELLKIPYGQTISYGELAKKLGNRNLTRAAAGATGANAVAVFVPCHRVVGVDGKLVGYAGGIAAKMILLNLENPNS